MYFPIFSTRFECGFTSSPLVSIVFFSSSPLVSSVTSHLPYSFRVYFQVTEQFALKFKDAEIAGKFKVAFNEAKVDNAKVRLLHSFRVYFASSPLVSSVF